MRAKFSVNKLLIDFRRGFSIVEVVVAMAVVVLLSAVGISTCIVALKIQSNAINTELVYNVSEEFISAFYGAAADEGDFKDNFKNRIIFALNCGEELTCQESEEQNEEEQNEITYTYTASGVTVEATITYKNEPFTGSIKVVGHIKSVTKAVISKEAVYEA